MVKIANNHRRGVLDHFLVHADRIVSALGHVLALLAHVLYQGRLGSMNAIS